VDLGILMVAELRPNKDWNGVDPLHFIGLERSPYTVAKTHVIWELIRQCASIPQGDETARLIDSILQVWFSSTWTSDKELAVRKVLDILCQTERTYIDEVRQTLEHWKRAPVMPLKHARQAQADRWTGDDTSIGTMKKRMDRVAVARYELTGDFAVGEVPTCGNKILFDCPDFTPRSASGESVFAPLDFTEVMTIANGSSPSLSILQATEEYARRGVKKLVDICQKGKVDVELVCSPVEASIDFVVSKRPSTMSWSNICDYMRYDIFHDVVRACSQHGNVIHFGYSMNWTDEVFGTSLIDYTSAKDRGRILDDVNKSGATHYASLGWDKRLSWPLRQSPKFLTNPYLQSRHSDKWVSHFFAYGQKAGGYCKVGPCYFAYPPCPIAPSGSSTVHFTWTYDPHVKFSRRTEK